MIRQWILSVISLVFTLFLTFKFTAAKVFLFIFGRLPSKVCTTLKKQNFQICPKLSKTIADKNQISKESVPVVCCLQSIIDSSISLCLTATLLNYNQILVKGTLLVSHKVHHSFLSIIYDQIPDYSKDIEQTYKSFLVWIFIGLGFFGISLQLAFFIDLINLLTLPTRLIYRVLRIIYSKSTKLMGKLYQFIMTKDEKWITYPYPTKYRNSNYRTLGLGLLIVLIQVTAITVFYYGWLSILMVALILIENALENLYRFILNLGYYICLLKGFTENIQSQRGFDRYISFFEPQAALRIIKGNDIFVGMQNSKINYSQQTHRFNFKIVYLAFLRINEGKNNDSKGSKK